ncbi:hypothetical protein KUTeg_022194 [Tegillarca granosa]|uniref:Uncharacterized protein n=1 Tax=Tegillarca granosa TaxID=220873 RepID=A0ABQ9EB28_TEGGR|nr:hypothetical protein KUTeg_022194 [Tegillarca granosa]
MYVTCNIGASLFSSNIGSEHFIGLAGAGAASGIAVISYEWMGMPLLILLAWLFLPVYISAGVYTLPEYMEKRFGGQRLRIYLSLLALVLYIVTKLAVTIFSGALFIQLAIGWNMYLSIVILLVITGIYTVFGGLSAVMYTDTFQTVVMTGGSFALMGIGFGKVGGYENLKNLYMNATPSFRRINSSCGEPREDAFHIFRDPITSDNPWPGLILQTSIGCLWYFCCDQVIVQRSLAAKNLSHAKAGSILAGYLKLIPLFIMIFPGIISRALFPDEVACIDPEECRKYCDNPVGCSNIAYPKLVLELMPHGARGLLVAVMLSAIMSSLTSIFNSASTLFTMDLWRRLRPISSERELLIVGRIFIVALCGVSILWIPLVRSSQGGQLFVYIQSVQGYLGTPIGALFLMALLWHRMTEYGAFWGILIGHLCGVIRMIIDFSFPSPDCDQPDLRPTVLSRVHYTYFGPLLLVLTSFSILVISYLTTPMEKDKVGASLFSSNIGSEHFVGLAGTGAASGIAIVSYEWMSMPLVLCLAWLFLPVYISAGVYTLPEFLEKRFGGQRIRIYMSILALVLYIVTKLAVSIFAGALFIQLALGWDMYLSIAALLVITGLYTILGGLAAVIYTDTFQTVVMTFGAFALIGGYSELERRYMQSVPSVRDENTTCGYPREDSFHMFRDPFLNKSVIFKLFRCGTTVEIRRVIVQRALAAKSLSHAKGGAILAGYLKILPLFIMIFPGMISRALYPDEVGCVDPEECKKYCDNPVGCSNIAYPKLVLELMPYGLRGLLMAVMLSAIMSSLTSIFNSSSTLFTMDLWRKMRKQATERELLIVGRLFIVILCGISILWIPLVRSSQGGQLFIYIQAVQDCDEPDTRPSVLAKIHYTYFGSLLLVITSLSIVVISLVTESQPTEKIEPNIYFRIKKLSKFGNNFKIHGISGEWFYLEIYLYDLFIKLSFEESSTSPVGKSWLKSWIEHICGVSHSGPQDMNIEKEQTRRFLKEISKWKIILNLNASLALVVIAFLYGFYH